MYRILKRLIDILLSLFGLVLISIPLIVIAIMIKIDSKGPVFFKQVRVGANDGRFTILKFRTMYVETPSDSPTHLLENADAYITKIGKILRKTSLDELPQIFNIIKGDMSIVGPRPSLPNQFDLNNLRNINGSSKLKPGLTGLAQIRGRDELPIPIKASFDEEYASKISFLFDTYIFFATFISVLRSDGVQDGYINDKHANYK